MTRAKPAEITPCYVVECKHGRTTFTRREDAEWHRDAHNHALHGVRLPAGWDPAGPVEAKKAGE